MDSVDSDIFIHAIVPRQAENQDKRRHSYSELGYDARIKSRMEFSTHPSQLGFCLKDLNGDGIEELIVGENGYIIAVYNKREDGTQYLMTPIYSFPGMIQESFSYIVGMGEDLAPNSYMYLCEDNVLAYVAATTEGQMAYYFAKVENGEYTWTDCVFYYPNNDHYKDTPWISIPDMTREHIKVPITEEQFHETVRSHPRVPLTLTPITEFPLADNSPSGIVGKDDVYPSISELLRHLGEYERVWKYRLLDLDGDGQQELFLTQGAWKGVLTVKNGKVKILECGEQLRICEGNYILHTQSYLDGNRATSVYRVQNGIAILVDYLRYDKDVNPENPWFYGTNAQDASLKPVSRQQYEAILAKYVPLELETQTVPQSGSPSE